MPIYRLLDDSAFLRQSAGSKETNSSNQVTKSCTTSKELFSCSPALRYGSFETLPYPDPFLAHNIVQGADTHVHLHVQSMALSPINCSSPSALSERGGHIHQQCHIIQHSPNLHTPPSFFNRTEEDCPPTYAENI